MRSNSLSQETLCEVSIQVSAVWLRLSPWAFCIIAHSWATLLSTLTELLSRLNGYCKLGFRRKLPNLELLVAVYFRVVRSSAFLQLHRAPELAVIIPRYDYCLCFVLDAMVNLFEFKGANMAVIGSFTRLPMSLEVGCLVDSWRVDSLRPVLSRVDGIIGL